MKTCSDAFQFEKELDWEKPAPGIRRQIMGYDGQLMILLTLWNIILKHVKVVSK